MTIALRSYMTWETPSPFRGSRVFRLPAWLPDPCYIARTELNLQGQKFPSGMDAIAMVAVDPGGRYTASTGFPYESTADQQSRDSPLFLSAPTVYREWTRLIVAEVGDNLRRFHAHDFKYPVRYSRSEGDLIAVDYGSYIENPPTVWACPRFSYLDPAGYGVPLPPAFAWSVGAMGVYPSRWPWPWLSGSGVFYTGYPGVNPTYNGDAAGRTIGFFSGQSWGNHFGQRFVAPAVGEISSATFRVRKLYSAGNVSARLYSDNNGAPGAQIGNPSWSVKVNYAWDIEVSFPIGCGALCVANTPYWLIFSSENNALSANIDTCSTLACFGSGRGNDLASITNNLPEGDTFLMLISAITP